MTEIMEYKHERPSIMILNDDCLHNIMAKLNIWDLMQLKQVNKHLNHLCRVQLSRTKELNFPALFPRTLKNWQFRKLADLYSLSLISMVVPISSHLTIKNIRDVVKKCDNLRSLKVIHGKSFNYRLIQMEKGLITGRRIMSFSVRQLDLCVGVYLKDILLAFPYLEELRCRSILIEKYSLGVTVPSNKLKSLKIFAQKWDQNFPLRIVPSLPMLEKFHLACEGPLSRYPDHDLIARMCISFSGNKKLKEIRMKHWALNDDGLLNFGNSIYGQLETLGFHSCSYITEEGFQSFLKTQPNLKTVDIRYVHTKPMRFLLRCLELYAETRPVKEEPLTVITPGCYTPGLSPKLNIVQASSSFECAF